MKKLLLTVSAITALSLLISGSGLAQYPPNTVGLFEFSDGSGAISTPVVGVPVSVFLVLIKPTDDQNGDTPYTTINAFECILNFNHPEHMLLLGETLPPDAVNSGDNTNMGEGFLEYIVEIGSDYPVTDESVMLIHFFFMHLWDSHVEVTLGPIFNPSIPGEMAFQSIPGEKRTMYPYNHPFYDFQFLFGQVGLALENDTFGSVKALYR